VSAIRFTEAALGWRDPVMLRHNIEPAPEAERAGG
jgi:hypothetical protein